MRTKPLQYLPVQIAALLYLLLNGLFFPGLVTASDLDCLVTATGKLIHWNAAWQEDGEDNNVIYRIVQIEDNLRDDKRELTLGLASLLHAQKLVRQISVTEERIANQICTRLRAEKDTF